MAGITTETYEHYHNKSYSTATKSLKLIIVKLIVPGELMVDLDRDEPMVEAAEIHMSMANCCFNSVKMAAETSLMGGHSLEQPCLACTVGDKLFGGI